MKAMVLAAGLGTRMRPLTTYRPKPLLPFMHRPLLEHVLVSLRRQGVHEVVINLHHRAAQLRQWLGHGRQWDMRLHLSYEPRILGTAGAMKRVEALLRDAPFLLINADVLVDLDLQAVWRQHCRRQALVTMVVRLDPAARAYGAVVVDADDRVRQINGRPQLEGRAAGLETIFTGVQVVSPEVLARIPAHREVSTTAEIYPALVAQGEAVHAYRHQGYWLDLGVPGRYLQAHWDLLDGLRGRCWLQSLPAATTAVLDDRGWVPGGGGATLLPPVVLGVGVELAPGACVGPYAVLGEACRLAAGAQVRESVLWEHVEVGAQARVCRSILGSGVRVRAGRLVCGMVRAGSRRQG